MTNTEFARGTWPGDVAWVAHRARKLSLPQPLLADWRLCSGAGVVVLQDSRLVLPHVVMTKRNKGRHGQPPRHEVPSGKLKPQESVEQAARREVLEETGAALALLTVYAYVEILALSGDISYMVHFVSHLVGRLGKPDPDHQANSMTLEQIGKLTRQYPPDVSVLDARLIREAVIAAGRPAQLVRAAMGPLG